MVAGWNLPDAGGLHLSLNTFRLSADFLHFFGILSLLYGLVRHRACNTVSLRSQELFLLVYTARYSDLWFGGLQRSPSVYNNFFKVSFTFMTIAVVVVIRRQVWGLRVHPEDSALAYLLVVPAAAAAYVYPAAWDRWEILWTFSLYLEAVALLPQVPFVQLAQPDWHNRSSFSVAQLVLKIT